LLVARGDSLDSGERKNIFGATFARFVNTNLFHFVSECEELSELWNKCFGGSVAE